MKNFNPIRQLARSTKWQILYARSKENAGIKLFSNESDFTTLQVIFLQWLEIYRSLEIELATDPSKISREIIDDDLRTDAYLYCQNLPKDEKRKIENTSSALSGIPTIIFTRGK